MQNKKFIHLTIDVVHVTQKNMLLAKSTYTMLIAPVATPSDSYYC